MGLRPRPRQGSSRSLPQQRWEGETISPASRSPRPAIPWELGSTGFLRNAAHPHQAPDETLQRRLQLPPIHQMRAHTRANSFVLCALIAAQPFFSPPSLSSCLPDRCSGLLWDGTSCQNRERSLFPGKWWMTTKQEHSQFLNSATYLSQV